MARKAPDQDAGEALRRFKSDLKAGTLGNFYIISGEEAFLRSHYVDLITKKIADGPAGEFNCHRFSADDCTPQALADAIDAMPMMAERTLVRVDDVDLFKQPEGAREQLTRKDAIAALGGGVAGDLAGFAASTYLRGIGFIQIPTTLLAMVDSSVGGKTAIDLPAGKNLAGTFYQPWLVLCDPDCLTTLPEEIFRDGCAEVIKYAVLGNAPFFDDLRAGSAHAQLEHIIETCVTMKRDIVAQDEFDRGQRQLLNLGHTFGHGIEACSGFAVSHGSAVAIGMAMMVRAAAAFGLCTEKTRDTVVDILRQYDLPVDCAFRAEDMLPTILHDKKAAGDTINLIVPTAVGQCRIVKTPASEIMDWLRAGGAR